MSFTSVFADGIDNDPEVPDAFHLVSVCYRAVGFVDIYSQIDSNPASGALFEFLLEGRVEVAVKPHPRSYAICGPAKNRVALADVCPESVLLAVPADEREAIAVVKRCGCSSCFPMLSTMLCSCSLLMHWFDCQSNSVS